jgi:hypothetical protein
MMTKSFQAVCLAILTATLPLMASAEAEIKYKAKVTVSVGQSVVVYGYRGECGQAPDVGAIDLPTLQTGKLSIGKAGMRDSKRCKGMTPAVEIIFTATAAGKEKFEVQGDDISVRVKE